MLRSFDQCDQEVQDLLQPPSLTVPMEILSTAIRAGRLFGSSMVSDGDSPFSSRHVRPLVDSTCNVCSALPLSVGDLSHPSGAFSHAAVIRTSSRVVPLVGLTPIVPRRSLELANAARIVLHPRSSHLASLPHHALNGPGQSVPVRRFLPGMGIPLEGALLDADLLEAQLNLS